MTTLSPTRDFAPIEAEAAVTARRDTAIDTMRGLAILMVIGIHALQAPLAASWQVLADAALRPCVAIFLFASGYLTALTRRVPLTKRLVAAIIPYTIAFAAAYLYMATHNPAMDQRLVVTTARYLLGYVFVYYYVFVYVGCTLALWLVFGLFSRKDDDTTKRLSLALLIAIGFGLVVGATLDPALARLGMSDSLIEEVRMRDLAFWFAFAATGALIGLHDAARILRDWRWFLLAATALAWLIYGGGRVWSIGDFGAYESVPYFGYAAMLCLVLTGFGVQNGFLAVLGSGSYFLYLWHIFIIMALRDHAELRSLGPFAASAIAYLLTATVSIAALLTVRRVAPPRVVRWLGA